MLMLIIIIIVFNQYDRLNATTTSCHAGQNRLAGMDSLIIAIITRRVNDEKEEKRIAVKPKFANKYVGRPNNVSIHR